MKKLIRRWQTKGGKHWFELYQDAHGFTYCGNGCGGNLGSISFGQALSHMQAKIAYAKLDGINMVNA